MPNLSELSSGVGAALCDTFRVARLVSQISAAILVIVAYVFGQVCFGKRVGLFALGCVILKYFVVKVKSLRNLTRYSLYVLS
jgi:hypothetical protein